MWRKLKHWLHDNKANLVSLICASMVVGLFFAAICLHPPILLALATFTFFGVAPLAFLIGLQLPLALLTIGIISSGLTLSLIAVVIGIDHELMNVFKHLSKLLKNERPPQSTSSDSPLYNKWLARPARTFEDTSEELSDEEDFSSSLEWGSDAETVLSESEEVSPSIWG